MGPLIFCCRSCRHAEPYFRCFRPTFSLAFAGRQRYDPVRRRKRPFHAKPLAGFRHDAELQQVKSILPRWPVLLAKPA
ncbi:hypothetical protein KCP78_07850 [Salmonella enterica subsp. enterica]|nr:hypothetical protein KCP78_07850 [Salmonella enterica subsp. enterica]